jgi:transposase
MATPTDTLAAWLSQAQLSEDTLTPARRGLLHAAFQFAQRCGRDYYSTRLLGHFLLHCGAGLKVAQVARLLGVNRSTASKQQGLSSKEVIQAAHHRMAGRPHGKLLPRYAGPIAQFLLTHAGATRYDVLDFIQRTWGVHVSTVALHYFLKKYGLDRATRSAVAAAAVPPATAGADRAAAGATAAPPPATPPVVPPRPREVAAAGQPVPLPAPPFSSHRRSTPAPFC